MVKIHVGRRLGESGSRLGLVLAASARAARVRPSHPRTRARIRSIESGTRRRARRASTRSAPFSGDEISPRSDQREGPSRRVRRFARWPPEFTRRADGWRAHCGKVRARVLQGGQRIPGLADRRRDAGEEAPVGGYLPIVILARAGASNPLRSEHEQTAVAWSGA